MKKLLPIFVVFMIFGILLGGPLVARGEIVQSLLILIKKDPSGGFTNAELNSRYYFRRLGVENFETYDREAEIVYGYINFKGVGLWDGQFTSFGTDGSIDTEDENTFNGSYSVSTDGSFTFSIDTSIVYGHISLDRNFIILSDGLVENADIIQGIITALRVPDSPLSLADLNGTWSFRDLELHDVENIYGDVVTCLGTMVCNNGTWNLSAECLESDGKTDTGIASGTYVLNGKNLDFYETGHTEVLISAYLSRDKNIFTCTRGSFSEKEFFKGIALKKGAKTYTNADLQGTYFLHDIVFENFVNEDREASISVGTITFDGNSNWTGTVLYFGSDGESGSDNISGTYSVNSDGYFILIVTSEAPNLTLTGNISGDNNTLIMSENISSRTPKAMPWIPLLLLDD